MVNESLCIRNKDSYVPHHTGKGMFHSLTNVSHYDGSKTWRLMDGRPVNWANLHGSDHIHKFSYGSSGFIHKRVPCYNLN